MKRELVENIGVNQSDIEVIYNPIVTPDIEPKSREPVDHPWFDDTDVPVILGVGRLTQQKDFPTLMRAFATLLNHRDARLVILGEGSDREHLEALATELRIEDKIELLGYVDNPYKYMRRADVFALSSAWEGFGNVIVEAMACGTTVVSTNCESGPAEILMNEKYGFLAPVQDETVFCEKLIEALANPFNSDVVQDRAADFDRDQIMPQYERCLFE